MQLCASLEHMCSRMFILFCTDCIKLESLKSASHVCDCSITKLCGFIITDAKCS